MSPEYPQAHPSYFERQRIVNSISIDSVGSPGRVKELVLCFEEERCVWERVVQDLEDKVHRLRCKDEEDKGRHEDG